MAESIDAPLERQRFLTDVRARIERGGTLGSSTAGLSIGSTTLSADEIGKVEQDLTHYLGPIAKLLVKRAAAQATSSAALRHAVAQHLEVPAERATFLSEGG